MAAPLAVSAHDVRKSFAIHHERRATLRELFAHGRAPEATEHVEALRGVTLEVPAGQFLGIVGRNGSGKSTLLRIIAGIYRPDAGQLVTHGRLSPFIEMGVGFRPSLSARENVMLSGSVLGASRSETRERLPEVFAFADLEGFADHKLQNFSSGMSSRLAFAAALQVQSDILLLDEVLAVGDAAFQEKCFAEFERLKREGRTVLLVTHNMAAVERFCDRAVLLDQGVIAADGTPEQVAEAYREVNRGAAPRPKPGPAPPVDKRALKAERTALVGNEVGRLVRLAAAMARADLAEHYQDRLLGYVWAVLRPLSLFLVLYFVYSNATGLGEGVKHYPVYLLTAIVLWTFFAETTSGGLSAMAGAKATLRRMRLPLLAVPLSMLMKAFFNLGVNLSVVVVFVAFSGIDFRLSVLQLPLLLLVLAVFATGTAMLLSGVYVRYRDVTQAWTVTLQLLFFASPILYVTSRLPSELQGVLDLNPIAAIFTQMRHALLDPSAPTAVEAAGGPLALLVPATIVVGAVVAGLWAFAREAPRMAERL